MSVAVIILAAGKSERLGSPKQLLAYNGKTLLQHSIDEAKNMGSDHVVVVLGANEPVILQQINDPGIIVLDNNKWKEGMASSIRCGISHLLDTEYESVIIMVCDQPYVNSALLKSIYQKYLETGNPIVASEYAGRPGTPALFHRSLFADLLLLKGDVGAKQIIQRKKQSVSLVGFPEGITDIDTREDYEALESK